jgi:hypothetical protein
METSQRQPLLASPLNYVVLKPPHTISAIVIVQSSLDSICAIVETPVTRERPTALDVDLVVCLSSH